MHAKSTQDSINLFAPEVRADPYPTYRRLRLGAPAQRVEPGGVWAVSRYEDVEHALKHPDIYSSSGFAALFKPDWLPHNPIGDSMVTKDGPGHAKLRALLTHAFTPRSVARLEPLIRAIAVELADHLAKLGQAEVIEDFCAHLPGRVIAYLLGLDPALHSQFRRWTSHTLSVSPIYPGDEIAAAIRATVAEMEGYFKEVVTARRREPQEDMVTDLIRAEVDGSALSDAEIIAFLCLLLPAGYETSTNMLALMMLDFAQRPEQLSRLRGDPSLIPAYVEEILRKEPPAHGLMRMTAVDTELGGVKIPQGAMVLLLLGSANRDESRIPDPERFDPTRAERFGVTFGHGIHFCLGAALARLEARVALEELVTRIAGFERLPGELEWNVMFHNRAPLALPLRVLPLQPAPATSATKLTTSSA
jgi:cytochrome P450